MAALGCVSTSDLDGIETRLADLQIQSLQLQKQNATRDQLLAVEDDLKKRIDKVGSSHADIQADIDRLELQVERLESKLDETNFHLSQLIQQLKGTQLELQGLRRATEEARRNDGPAAVPAPAPRPSDLDETDPEALYSTAYNDYLAGNYDLAIIGFSSYLELHGTTDQADNATYWLGECYYKQAKFEKAVRQFAAVLEFTGSDRTASARIRKAYAHLELGEKSLGEADLQKVVCDFGGTDEAHLARQRLLELGFDPEC